VKIFIKSALAGLVAMVLGFVIYVVGTFAVMSAVVERRRRRVDIRPELRHTV